VGVAQLSSWGDVGELMFGRLGLHQAIVVFGAHAIQRSISWYRCIVQPAELMGVTSCVWSGGIMARNLNDDNDEGKLNMSSKAGSTRPRHQTKDQQQQRHRLSWVWSVTFGILLSEWMWMLDAGKWVGGA
jgi:hypothetical protein